MSKSKKRVYGRWGGNPKGVAEDETRCAEKVWSRFQPGGYQCLRKRGYGPKGEYCKQHAKKFEER